LTIFVSLYVTNQGNYTKVNILSLYKHTVVNSEELHSEVTYLYIYVFPLDCEILHPYLVVFSLGHLLLVDFNVQGKYEDFSVLDFIVERKHEHVRV
jgi:hypothetical protein